MNKLPAEKMSPLSPEASRFNSGHPVLQRYESALQSLESYAEHPPEDAIIAQFPKKTPGMPKPKLLYGSKLSKAQART